MSGAVPLRLGREHAALAVATLADAFSTNIVVTRLALGRRTVERMYRIPLNTGFAFGEVLATSGLCEGVMVFTPGERSSFGVASMIASGSLLTMLGLVPLAAESSLRRLSVLVERDRKNLRIGPHYYLNVIGVAREHQGDGHGGRLLAHLCERADADGRAVYLETQTDRNVRWYERFGFSVVGEARASDWLVMRELVRPGPVLHSHA